MANLSEYDESASGVREDILQAARAEFASNGRRGVSVRAIAARAGVTAAMINYYYGSKQALYDVVVEGAQARLFGGIAAVMREGDPADAPARIAGVYFDFLSEEREMQQLLLHEVLEDGEGVQQLVRKYVVPMRALFERHFGSDEDTFQAAISLFGVVAAYFLYAPVLGALRGEDPLSAEHLARRRQHVVAVATLLGEMRTK